MDDVPDILLPMHLAPAMVGDGHWLMWANSVIASGLLLRLLWRHWQNAFRPSVMIAGLLLVFYTAPAILYSGHYNDALRGANWLAPLIFLPLAFSAWATFTARWWKLSPSADNMISNRVLVASMLPWTGLLSIYLLHVPVRCTALYAMISDAHYTLLARELSVKMLGSNAATYAQSMLVSVGAPMALWALSIRTVSSIKERGYLRMLIYIACICVVLASLLINGAKGNLIPSAITLAACSLLLPQQWKIKFLGLGCVVLFFIVAIYCVDRARYIPPHTTPYPLSYCVKQLDLCDKSYALLNTMIRPEGSLGLTRREIGRFSQTVINTCPAPQAARTTPPPPPPSRAQPIEPYYAARDAGTIPEFTPAEAILYRAFVTPSQVASWYYLDQKENGPRGMHAIPIMQRYTGNHFSMAEYIYQSYGSVFSAGDRTAGSTAPTSFMLSYPAYLPTAGIIFAGLLVIAFDIGACIIVRFAYSPLSSAAAGLLAVASFNMITSDFFTVLLSHGAGLGGLLIVGLTFIQRLQRCT